MATITDPTNTGAIQKFYDAKQADRKDSGYKWNLTTKEVKSTLSSPQAKKLIDDFSKTTADVDKDGIISSGPELTSFLTFAKKYDNFDKTANQELYTYLKDQWATSFINNSNFDNALDQLFNANQLNSAVSANNLAKLPESLFLKTLISELQLQGTEISKRINELKAKITRTAPEDAELTRLTALQSNSNFNKLQTQAKSAIDKTKAEEQISSFFTTQDSTTKGFKIDDDIEGKNINQIEIDKNDQPINKTEPSSTPTTPGQTDEQVIDRATKSIGNAGNVDTIAYLADRATTRLEEVKRRIDTPEVEAALIAFINKSTDVSKQINTRRISLSHILGSETNGKDISGVFSEMDGNKKFQEVIIKSIRDSQTKKSPENTYLFLVEMLEKYYGEEFKKVGIARELPANATETIITENLNKMIDIFNKGLGDNRDFMKKIRESLDKKIIKTNDDKNNSIWEILGSQAKDDQEISLKGNLSFNATFPANMSPQVLKTATSAKISLTPLTNINAFIKSLPEEDKETVRGEVSTYANKELKENTKKGILLEISKKDLINALNTSIGLSLDANGGTGNLQNEVPPEKRREAQIIIGKLILVEQAISVRNGLVDSAISNKKPDYFSEAVAWGTKPEVSKRVQGLLGEFQKQEEAYNNVLDETAKNTLAPLGKALNGIFNFDVGFSPIRSYAFAKDDLNITRAIVQMVLVKKVNDTITKTELGENGALSEGSDGKSADEKSISAANVLGLVNSSIQNLVGEATKAQEANAKLGQDLVNGVTTALGNIKLSGGSRE